MRDDVVAGGEAEEGSASGDGGEEVHGTPPVDPDQLRQYQRGNLKTYFGAWRIFISFKLKFFHAYLPQRTTV